MTRNIVYKTENNEKLGKFNLSDEQERDLERCSKDPVYFIMEVVKTIDEHDKVNPYKNLPNHQYIKELIQELMDHKMIIGEKTRQMKVSWICLAYMTWEAIFHKSRKYFVMSKKESHSDAHIQRIVHIVKNLPAWIRPSGVQDKYCHVKFKNGSEIFGFSQNPDDPAQFTFSGGLIDEDERQPMYRECLKNAMPTIDGGGWLMSIGNANGKPWKYRVMTGEAMDLDTKVFNDIKESTGFRRWTNAGGWRCFRLHYTADPNKRKPEWYKENRPRYSEYDWEQQFEINRDISSGDRVYPRFHDRVHCCDLEYNRGRPLYISWDFGAGRPAVVFFQFDDQGRMLVLDELMGKDMLADEFCQLVGNHVYKNFRNAKVICYGDPTGNQKKDTGYRTKDGRIATSISIAKKYGFRIKSKKRSVEYGISLVNQLLKLRKDHQPAILFDWKCETTISAMRGGYVWKEDLRGNRTGDPDKDGFFDHLMDALRYGVTNTISDKDIRPMVRTIGDRVNGVNSVRSADDSVKVSNRFSGGGFKSIRSRRGSRS